jgi:hypothetical protein
MSVQSVWRAKHYFSKVEGEFCEPSSYIRSLRGGVKAAYSVDLYLGCVNYLREVVYEMATKAPRDKKREVTFNGFVNHLLTPEDKELFKTWDCDDHDLWILLQTDIQSGYKISVSFNTQNDTFNATYMCTDEDSPNHGYCLSAFAPDWYNAVKSLVFKHNVVLECVWPLDGKTIRDTWG